MTIERLIKIDYKKEMAPAIPNPRMIEMNFMKLKLWFSLISKRMVVDIYRNIPITKAIK